MNKIITQLLFLALFVNVAQGQQGHVILKTDLEDAQQYKERQTPVSLFKISTRSNMIRTQLPAKLQDSPVLSIEAETLEELAKEKPYIFDIVLPTGGHQRLNEVGSQITLELIQFDVLSPNFTQTLMPSGEVMSISDLKLSTSYRGIVKELDNSIVTVNISETEFSMILSTPDIGNLVLEKLTDETDQYLLYEDKSLLSDYTFECQYLSHPGSTNETTPPTNGQKDAVDGCFTVFFDIGKTIYDARGDQATDYLVSIFTHVATLYFNEQINIAIGGTNIWTTTEPFLENLDAYTNYLASNPVDASFSHYVHGAGGGGIAYLTSFCASNNRFASGMNGLENQNAQPLPNYSWPVYLIAHEIGHNFGSEHTHDCAWNGNSTPIDGCGSQYNGCGISNYLPPEGGTVMSYCHLQNVGVNLSLGFGTQPGDRMRFQANQAACKGYSVCTEVDNEEGICTGNQYEYTLTNIGSGKVLEIGGFNTDNGGNAQQWDYANVSSQKWYFEDVGNEQYTLTNFNSGKVLEVEGSSTSSAANVHQWDYSNANNQKWILQESNNSQYELINVNSGLALDVSGASNSNGANVQQWTPNSTNAQKWTIQLRSGNQCSNECADVGQACDDGDDCTENSIYDANCNCGGGTLIDADGDQICDAEDQCPNLDNDLIGTTCNDNNPNTQNDIWQANCICEGTLICNPGASCNDGNPCTTGETFDANCNCVGGTIVDTDGDGVCDSDDQCPGLNDNLIGQACDDGDPCTTGESYNANCGCAGGILLDENGDGVCDFVECESDASTMVFIEGDMFLTESCSGIILTTSSGNCFKIILGASGELSTVAVNCPD